MSREPALSNSTFLGLPGGAIGAVSLIVFGALLAIAVGALPLVAAVIVAVGLPLAVLSIAVPRVMVALILLSVPFQSFTKVTLGAYDITSTDVLVGVLIGSWLLRSIVEHRVMLHGGATIGAAIALLGAAILGSLTATSFSAAAKEDIKIAELIAVAIFAASTMRGAGDVKFFFWALLGAAVCESCVGIFQFITGRGPETFAIGPFIRAYGDFSQPNAFAGYVAMILPFGIMWTIYPGRHRPIAAAATIVVGIALLASMSRGAWLGSLIGLAGMALAWSQTARRLLPYAAIAMATLIPAARVGLLPRQVADRISVVFENFFIFDARTVKPDAANWSIVERMAQWQAAWGMASSHPILGVGPGNYEVVYPDYYVPGWPDPLPHAHNLYLNFFAEAGIFGLVAFVAFTIIPFIVITRALMFSSAGTMVLRFTPDENLLRRAFLVAALGAAITFSVHNTFDNMFIHGMGVQFGLILGLVEAQIAALQNAQQPDANAPPVSESPPRFVYANWD